MLLKQKMITKDKNKLKSKTKSKILVLGLMLFVLIGLFSLVKNVSAQSTLPLGNCVYELNGNTLQAKVTERYCNEIAKGKWTASSTPQDVVQADIANKAIDDAKAAAAGTDPNEESALYGSLDDCGVIIRGSLLGCFQVFTYLVFVTVPSFLMGLAANFFNFLASLTISSEMYKLDFIDKIWKVVRDFANIFFILILLYAAFQIILGLHESGAKKIIGMVILVALLVNFSLFFTKIVIDSSNIVALIFYNRIDTTNVGSYEKIGNVAKTGVAEKDMAGALVSRFNINTFFDGELFKKLGEEGKVRVKYKFFSSLVLGSPQFSVDVEINPYVLISMMVAYGLVVYAITYAFFMTAMSFLGRMITLMMLMIISPLAFVTAAVP